MLVALKDLFSADFSFRWIIDSMDFFSINEYIC